MRLHLEDPEALAEEWARENAWGQHPECPIEVLDDGSRIWREPPGATVLYPHGLVATLVGDSDQGYYDVAVTVNGERRVCHWRDLRRV